MYDRLVPPARGMFAAGVFIAASLIATGVFVPTRVYGAPPVRADESPAIGPVSSGLIPCPALATDGRWPPAVAAAVGWMRPMTDGVVPSLAALPARAAFVVCAMAESALEESGLAGDRAGGMSRRDALWLQAGYGEGRSTTIEGPSLDFPKWSATDPSLFRFLPGQTEQTKAAPSLFSFQIGH